LIELFVGTKTFHEYKGDVLLVSAVERQLSIVGEAVTQLKKLLPEGSVSNATQIIGFRNILIHNYARVSQAVLWTIVHDHLPVLKLECQALIGNAV
jgi:uncharacterized protein with HEPN domain